MYWLGACVVHHDLVGLAAGDERGSGRGGEREHSERGCHPSVGLAGPPDPVRDGGG
jgi:hypothetical protein